MYPDADRATSCLSSTLVHHGGIASRQDEGSSFNHVNITAVDHPPNKFTLSPRFWRFCGDGAPHPQSTIFHFRTLGTHPPLSYTINNIQTRIKVLHYTIHNISTQIIKIVVRGVKKLSPLTPITHTRIPQIDSIIKKVQSKI